MLNNRIEGVWDCPYCNSIQILAHLESCPNCGHKRGIDTIFYISDNPHILSEEEKVNTTNKPDWICEYCGGYNRDDIMICTGCGANRKESKKHYGILHQLTGESFKRSDF